MTDERTRPIVVGVDGSAVAEAARRWATAEAARRGRPLTVVATKPARGVSVPSPNVHIRNLTVTPAPGRAVVDATEGAAMLVVGSPGTGRRALARLGPVGAYCVRHARCPVVIVPVPRAAAESAHTHDAGLTMARQSERASEPWSTSPGLSLRRGWATRNRACEEMAR